ncbi:uncharacterized protein LOC114362165 isoform X2 [Ostrinia furnacalis]|uniref:uncharacterized protein LOC114362165 isoform X2 n=1 Tax=Ostrinia furnacalis TaxID=93504 RepID=UPI001040C688|nr:uncharacterized protein LOC114362165 isoform X2 [Ostrinia furnacalis]
MFRCGRDFCLETSIHGFNHIAVPNRHWTERLLWLVITSAAIWGAVSVSLGQLQRYNENPTVITLEKDFRTWRYSLPGVTTCDRNRVNPSKLPSAIAERWHVDPSDPKYPYYAKFVSNVANSDLFHLEGYEEFKDDETLNVDLYQLVIDVQPDPQVKTTWSQSSPTKWIPVITEAGACYATNSIAVNDVATIKLNANDTKNFPITCKYSSFSCFVIMELDKEADFYVHSPYDVSDITQMKATMFASLNRQSELSVMETHCGQGVYSTNTCRLACRSRLAIKLCGCKPFYYIHQEGPICTPAGMHCLSSHAQQLKVNGGQKCSCSPQCLDATFREIASNEEIWGKGPFSTRGTVRFTIQPPRTRYTREIVFYFQDLVVSFGGAAGLFLGASFISFVEMFYFVMERVFGLFGRRPRKHEHVKSVETFVPYEAKQIMELTTILENERKYEQLLDAQKIYGKSYKLLKMPEK